MLDRQRREEDAFLGDPELAQSCNVSADAILAALEAEGLAVVPVEPTEAMIHAGAKELVFYEPGDDSLSGDGWMADAYRAMLAAGQGEPR